MNEDWRERLDAERAAETLRMAQEGKVLMKDEHDRCANHEEDFVTNPDQLLLGYRQE